MNVNSAHSPQVDRHSNSPPSRPNSQPPSYTTNSNQHRQDDSRGMLNEFTGRYQSQWSEYYGHRAQTSNIPLSSSDGSQSYPTLHLNDSAGSAGPGPHPCPAEVDGTARQWLHLIDKFNVMHFEYRRTAQQLQYMTIELQSHVEQMSAVQSLCLTSGRNDIALPMAAAVETARRQIPRLVVTHSFPTAESAHTTEP
ncbi:hypothetical protein DFP72DRAFT_900896 [Ephemerocybe angulata]|uniref:Uncharacterized protein n=1 Tax=Ephemerocybe angulata TaxID=980116 RepID=A0A8H6M2X1_9AGAR|nr:hypothetical protein DFP72DRAFT_900896 [Tulosesus angulatus]